MMNQRSSRPLEQSAKDATFTPQTSYTEEKRMAFESIREMQRLQEQIKFLQQQEIEAEQRKKNDLLQDQKTSFSELERSMKQQQREYLSEIKEQEELDLSQLTSSVSSQEKQWTRNANDFRREKAARELEERKRVNDEILQTKLQERQKIIEKISQIHGETREFDLTQRERAEAYQLHKSVKIMREKEAEIEWLNREKETADQEIERLMEEGRALGLFQEGK